LHENIEINDEKHTIISDDNEKIKVRGARKPPPTSVTMNGEPLQYSSYKDILKSVFKILVDKNKITKDNCSIVKSKGDRGIIMNIKPEYLNEAPFLGAYGYKNIFLECHGSASAMITRSQYLIDTFGDKEFILNIKD
jgi:hypothetical protein